MTQEHPITPPDYLVKEWSSMYWQQGSQATFTDAVRWGADQELEACIQYFHEYDPSWGEDSELIVGLRSTRRPKPPSLKAQALELVDRIEKAESVWAMSELDTIRRALESLPE